MPDAENNKKDNIQVPLPLFCFGIESRFDAVVTTKFRVIPLFQSASKTTEFSKPEKDYLLAVSLAK